jgi:hypothetical protein
MLSHAFTVRCMGKGVKWRRDALVLKVQGRWVRRKQGRTTLHHFGLAPSGTGIRSMPIYGRNTSGNNTEPSAC